MTKTVTAKENGFKRTFEVDEDTGFPKVPEGFFWRVKKSREYASLLEVQLRKQRRFFSSLVGMDEVYCSKVREEGEVVISDAAANVIRWSYHRVWNDPLKGLLGDYPPKGLSGKE